MRCNQRANPIDQILPIVRREPRSDWQLPHPLLRERATFYGIFARHQDGSTILEGQIRRCERMVIREGVLLDLEPGLAQQIEKSSWVTDGRDRVHPLVAEALKRAPLARIIDPSHRGREQSQLELAMATHPIGVPRRSAVDDDVIHAR